MTETIQNCACCGKAPAEEKPGFVWCLTKDCICEGLEALTVTSWNVRMASLLAMRRADFEAGIVSTLDDLKVSFEMRHKNHPTRYDLQYALDKIETVRTHHSELVDSYLSARAAGGKMNRLDKKCDKCGAKDWICVQYAYPHPDRYDGVSEIRCQQCGTRYGRWTDRILEIGESEPPFGDPSLPASGAKEGE